MMQSVRASDETWETEWGGHARAVATVSEPDEQSVYRFVDTDTAYDGQTELRLKNRTFIGTHWSIETHYEAVALGGDTYERDRRLAGLLPADTAARLTGSPVPGDDQRLMDLTRRFSDGKRATAYHRLDRLNVNYSAEWGGIRFGRQALTWGNGLLFNPMDLFNPFSPTTVQRDYKTGDDMLHGQFASPDGNLQLLYVPRRDPRTGKLEQAHSSTAVKWHRRGESVETDLMLARHYEDRVGGVGFSGYLGGAVWRTDAVYTRLDQTVGEEGYLQFIANLDYAWTWWGRNVYGSVELYYNEFGADGDYGTALSRPALLSRLQRGELFTLGRRYLAGTVQIEWHPLVRFRLTAIANTGDPSGILQPQVTWDVSNNLELIAGASGYWGGSGTEFGGFNTPVEGAMIEVAPSNRLFVWLTRYF